MAAMMMLTMVTPAYQAAYATARDVVRGEGNSPTETWQIASGLSQLGLQPGDHVAIIGWGATEASWARLARLKIVEDIVTDGWGFPDGDIFWASSEAEKAKVYQVLAQTGTKALVGRVPNSVTAQGWKSVGNTTQSVYFLER